MPWRSKAIIIMWVSQTRRRRTLLNCTLLRSLLIRMVITPWFLDMSASHVPSVDVKSVATAWCSKIELAVRKTCLLFHPIFAHFSKSRATAHIDKSHTSDYALSSAVAVVFDMIFVCRFAFKRRQFFHVWNFENHSAKNLMSTSAADGSCFHSINFEWPRRWRIFFESLDFYIYGFSTFHMNLVCASSNDDVGDYMKNSTIWPHSS